MKSFLLSMQYLLQRKITGSLAKFISGVFVLFTMLISIPGFSQTPYSVVGQSKLVCPFDPSKQGPCQANDLQVLDLFVDNLNDCQTCTPGATVTADLYMRINNTTGSVRTSFALFGTLSAGASIESFSGKIFICVGPINILKGINSFKVGQITFECGKQVTLTENYLAYTPANSTTQEACAVFSNATTCQAIGPKCGVSTSIIIKTPVTATASTVSEPCIGTTTGGSISIVPTGGIPGYTIDIFKKGTGACATTVPAKTQANGYVSSLSVSTSGGSATTAATLSPGDYCIYIKDSKGCEKMITHTIAGKSCCTSPVVTDQPDDVALCTPNTATFTVGYTDGSPAALIQWQLSTDGTNYNNLANGSPYSGVTTATLTVNPTAVALSGNRYRAVLTSGTCAPATTNAARLTVNPLPEAQVSGTTAVCKGSTAPNVTFTGSGGTAPYTFTYKINTGSNQTVTTVSGNSVTVAAPTATAGTYTYTLISVQDASTTTCSQLQSGSAVITVNPLPEAQISGTTAVCKGSTSPNVSFTGSGGTAPYTFTYKINTGSNQTVTTVSGNSVTVAAPTATAGTYTYTLISVQDASTTTCSQSQSGTAVITVDGVPLKPVVTIQEALLCGELDKPGVTVTNAFIGATYSLTQAAGGISDSKVATSATVIFTGLTAGKGFTITADNKGCSPDAATCPVNLNSATTSNMNQKVETYKIQLQGSQQTKVIAAPNPFNDKIRFTLESEVSGNGSLELFNTLGQKVKTVFQGRVEAGKMQTIEYNVPGSQRSNLIYVFRVGEQKTTGKLIGLQ